MLLTAFEYLYTLSILVTLYYLVYLGTIVLLYFTVEVLSFEEKKEEGRSRERLIKEVLCQLLPSRLKCGSKEKQTSLFCY